MAIKQLEPYVNEIKMDDPMVERVRVEKTDIGANAAGLPKVGKNDMALQHVAGGVGGARG